MNPFVLRVSTGVKHAKPIKAATGGTVVAPWLQNNRNPSPRPSSHLPDPLLVFQPFARPLSPLGRYDHTRSLLLLSPLRQRCRLPPVNTQLHQTSSRSSSTMRVWMATSAGLTWRLPHTYIRRAAGAPLRRAAGTPTLIRDQHHPGIRKPGSYFVARSPAFIKPGMSFKMC